MYEILKLERGTTRERGGKEGEDMVDKLHKLSKNRKSLKNIFNSHKLSIIIKYKI